MHRLSPAILSVAIPLAAQDHAVAGGGKASVSPCEPLCALLLAEASVYPLSPVKTNVSRLCEYDLEPLWKGLSPCRMGRTFSVFRTDQAVIGGKQGSRRSPAKRGRWEEETQRNE